MPLRILFTSLFLLPVSLCAQQEDHATISVYYGPGRATARLARTDIDADLGDLGQETIRDRPVKWMQGRSENDSLPPLTDEGARLSRSSAGPAVSQTGNGICTTPPDDLGRSPLYAWRIPLLRTVAHLTALANNGAEVFLHLAGKNWYDEVGFQ